jgi:hypothetical protein
VFCSADWIAAWLETYGHEYRGRWLRWEDGGAVVGGCLLLTGRVAKGPLRLTALYVNASGEAPTRTPLVEFNDVLSLPGQREAIASDLAARLGELPWHILRACGYETRSVLARVVERLPSASMAHETSPAPYARLAGRGAADVEASLTGSTGNRIRASRRTYESRDGALAIERAAGEPEALAMLEALAALSNRRFAGKGVEGSFESEAVRAFHRRLVPRLLARGEVDLLAVRAGTTVVGYLYNFTSRGKVYAFQSGFRYEADSRIKPGLVCHAMALARYARQGAAEYDFLAGDGQHKRSLSTDSRTLAWTTLVRDTAWLRAAAWVRDRLRTRAFGKAA